jgi:hypothetical protein
MAILPVLKSEKDKERIIRARPTGYPPIGPAIILSIDLSTVIGRDHQYPHRYENQIDLKLDSPSLYV